MRKFFHERKKLWQKSNEKEFMYSNGTKLNFKLKLKGGKFNLEMILHLILIFREKLHEYFKHFPTQLTSPDSERWGKERGEIKKISSISLLLST